MGMSEGEIIALIREMASGAGPGVRVPIGDDAALFDFAGGSVLLTVDSIYEGVHFSLETFGYSDVGWKAVAAGVSDIAAMGGEPSCALLSLGFGAAPMQSDVCSLIGGVLEMAASCNLALIGGDVCRSGAGLALTVTVAGIPPSSGAVLRSGAHPGDVIGVTGQLGDSGAGLHVLREKNDDMRARFPGLVEAHLRPKPRVQAGVLLAAAGVSAMEDVSDGLAPDLGHICVESDAGCEVEAALIPVGEMARDLAAEAGIDPLEWALGGGEDYELIFTADPDDFEKAVDSLALHGVPAARVGAVTERQNGRVLITERGREELKGKAYEHF